MAGQLLFAVGIVLGFAARAGRNQRLQHTQHQTAQALCFYLQKIKRTNRANVNAQLDLFYTF